MFHVEVHTSGLKNEAEFHVQFMVKNKTKKTRKKVKKPLDVSSRTSVYIAFIGYSPCVDLSHGESGTG